MTLKSDLNKIDKALGLQGQTNEQKMLALLNLRVHVLESIIIDKLGLSDQEMIDIMFKKLEDLSHRDSK
jgi:hypothetical protein